jgi:protein required for attachment to host cells
MNEIRIPKAALILVGDGRKALFLVNRGSSTHPELQVERVLQQPDLATREQGTDRPGRYQSNDITSRSAFAETDWHQLAQHRFAGEIAAALYQSAHAGRFEQLILVAPPKVLGELREQLHEEVRSRIAAELPKDLTSQPIPEIARTLTS